MKFKYKEFLERINIKRILRYLLFMFLSLVTQNMVFTKLRIFGVCPMVLPAVAVAVGMFEGASWGAVFSLIMGIFADMAFVENTILFTVLFPAIAFFSGFVSQFFINRRFFAFMLTAAFALFVTATVQAMKTFALDGFTMSAIPTVVMQTLWSLPPAAVAYFPPAKWIE